ncbi:hypothetical protein [Rhodoferax sp. BLA1]|uniref:hypothetical protein n=1 Tax=Rhodoferax sp. BLA1 TaxID=2576062 RepID=UPI0015D39AA2|nr:hypothetical protein [Rhodoferax sp. BLA1]
MNTLAQPCACRALPQDSTPSLIPRWMGAVRRFWASWKAARRARLELSHLTALDGLNAETLKDIGAPEWLQAQVYTSQQRAHQGGLLERDSLHWR